MKRYKVAAIIIMVHSLVEIGGFFSVLPLWLGVAQSELIPFDPPPVDIMLAGLIWGTIRMIGGIGLIKNMMWGLVLSIINCIIAMAMMMTVLPFGIMDGILAGTALILVLTKYFDKKKIVEAETEYTASGKLHDAKEALQSLRRKHFG